jgi:hypothetical protein
VGDWPGLACVAARVVSCQCACHHDVHEERACRAALRSPPHKSLYTVRTRHLTFTGRLYCTDTAGVSEAGDTSTFRLPHRRGRNQPFPFPVLHSGSHSRRLPASTSFPLSLLSQSPMGDSDWRHCSILSGRNNGAIVLPPTASVHPSIHPFHRGPFISSHFILSSSPKLTALVRWILPLEYTVTTTQISVGNTAQTAEYITGTEPNRRG